ncbi:MULTISPECIES: c-type cytochrome [Halomonas]|uniref:c-type cytochrome n=1 Tax=Halomonas TaxID=2745 RepID=UPI001FE1C144|nr:MULTISPECIES: c-type cytochrome [Halomonas]
MKSSKLIMGCLATLGLTVGAGTAMAQDDAEREAIAERLAPVGELCVQGEDCGTMAAASGGGSSASSGGGGDIDGEGIYNNVCMACHETGAAGAPVRGNDEQWSARTEKGFATLLDHAINGFNAMPAKGGNPNLSDAEVEAAVAYLVEPVMEVPAQGGGDAAAAEGEASSGDSGGEASADAAVAGIDGEAIYNQVCMACHETGAAGAPVRGNAEQWSARAEQGIETLYDHSINGFNAMPAKGGNPNLSDDEVKAATNYLVEPVMDVTAQGGGEAAPAEDASSAETAASEQASAAEDTAADSADESQAAAEPAHAGIDGAAIYNQICMACHETGAAGAPVRGNAEQWSARLEQGVETLYDHSINGFNAMPAKGGNPNLSDDEVKAATDYLIEPVQ